MINNQNHSRHPELDSRHSVLDTESKTPKLRFKEFSGEWEEKRFGDIYSFYSTNSFSRDNLNYDEGNIRNIHYGDIHTKFSTLFKLENERVPFINPDVNLAKIKEENYCLVGDLVIADASEDYNDIGKSIEIISLNNEKTLAGLHTFLARPNKHNMALGFVGSLLKSWNVRKQIMTIAQGTKVLSLSSGRLSEVTLNVPSISEQQKIATFLSAVDTKIDQLTRKKDLLEQYKKGVMQKIFSQELRFKDDNENEFPEWEEKKLGEVLESIPTKKYQIKTSEIKDFGKYLVVDQGQDLIAGFSDEVEMLFTNHPVVVFGDHTTVLKYIDYEFIIGADGTKVLKCKKDHPKYVFYNLGFNNVQQEGYKRHFTMLSEIYLQIPSLAEQTKIANFLSAIDTKIDHVAKQLDEAKNFKKGLLQQMFV